MAITTRDEVKYTVSSPYFTIKYSLITIYEEEGKELSRKEESFYRMPGDDLSSDPTEIQELASTLWTSAVIESYQNYLNDYYSDAS